MSVLQQLPSSFGVEKDFSGKVPFKELRISFFVLYRNIVIALNIEADRPEQTV